jgi:transposase
VFGACRAWRPHVARVVPDAKTVSLRPIVLENVERGTTISTDELRSYGLLTKDGYRHGRVNHAQKEYARYVCKSLTFHTNTVEGFLAAVQGVGALNARPRQPKHMQRYLNEFTFRANHRERVNGMFDLLVGAL